MAINFDKTKKISFNAVDRVKKSSIQGLVDIQETHLNKTKVWVKGVSYIDLNGPFVYFKPPTPKQLSSFKSCYANVEALPDNFVPKTSALTDQGETIYMRFLNPIDGLLGDRDKNAGKFIIPAFALIDKFIVYIGDEIDYEHTPVYVLTDALTKGAAYDMNRYYAVRNDFFVRNWFKG